MKIIVLTILSQDDPEDIQTYAIHSDTLKERVLDSVPNTGQLRKFSHSFLNSVTGGIDHWDESQTYVITRPIIQNDL